MTDKMLQIVATLERQSARRIRYQPRTSGSGWWRFEAEAVVDEPDPNDESHWEQTGVEAVQSLTLEKTESPAATADEAPARASATGGGHRDD